MKAHIISSQSYYYDTAIENQYKIYEKIDKLHNNMILKIKLLIMYYYFFDSSKYTVNKVKSLL